MQLPRPVERVIGGRPHSKCSRLRAGDKRHDASCELRSGRNWGPRAGAGRCRRCKLCRKRSVHARDDRVVHQVESFRDELKMHPIVHGNIARHAEVNVADARPGMAVAFCGGWSFTAVFVIVEVQCAIRKRSQVPRRGRPCGLHRIHVLRIVSNYDHQPRNDRRRKPSPPAHRNVQRLPALAPSRLWRWPYHCGGFAARMAWQSYH